MAGRSQEQCSLLCALLSNDRMDGMTASQTARQLARAELTRAIKEAATRQLAETGAAALSLRAVARDLGLASSALYRYFPSRDALLTALIIDAFNAVGAAAESGRSPPLPPIRAPGGLPHAGRSASGPWPTRTSSPWSTARPSPATRPRPTRSTPPPGSPA